MREYIIHKGWLDEVRFNVKQDNDCVFCSHCTDIFWDYTNGIYALICDLGREEVTNSSNHTCKEFDDYFVKKPRRVSMRPKEEEE